MRLPLIAQADLSPEQRRIYEDMCAGIERSFQGFKNIAENGALLGPWNPWLTRTEVWKADLGTDQGALGLARSQFERGGDPGHRREISLGL